MLGRQAHTTLRSLQKGKGKVYLLGVYGTATWYCSDVQSIVTAQDSWLSIVYGLFQGFVGVQAVIFIAG